MAFSNFYLTAKGRELLAKAQTGTQLAFTRVQIGEGVWPEGTTYDNLTALVMPVKYLVISKMTSAAGQAKLTVDFTNKGVGRAFHWTECALWAADPEAPEDRSRDILYGAAYGGEKPIPIEAALTEFQYNIILTVSLAANVSIVIDESLVYVSRREFDEPVNELHEHIADPNAHGGRRATIQVGGELPQGPCLWFDTSAAPPAPEPSETETMLLVLGEEGAEGEILAEIEEEGEYPVENASLNSEPTENTYSFVVL